MKLKKIDGLNKPYKIYAEVLESGAIEQFVNVMEHDAIVQGALMPDAHKGYSLPIGGVVASQDIIFPSYVGYDIGCGMSALKLNIKKEEIEPYAKRIFDGIYADIPVGFKTNDKPSKDATELKLGDLSKEGKTIAESKNYLNAIGSLGGGNHFIEIGTDGDDDVWIVIHSGSRGVGHGIATHYMKLASGGKKAKEGNHGLSTDSEVGQAYINDMNWALQFALDNRREMIDRVAFVIHSCLDMNAREVLRLADWDNFINRNHNHATVRDGLWIHRKGATHAEEGMNGVIPGNMRDGSFIVRGKGNPDSLYSSSHGAGRVLSRKKAKEIVNLDDFKDTMQGVTALVDEKTLDESPFAYKNIFDVMRLQSDLVDVVHHVKPLINIKG